MAEAVMRPVTDVCPTNTTMMLATTETVHPGESPVEKYRPTLVFVGPTGMARFVRNARLEKETDAVEQAIEDGVYLEGVLTELLSQIGYMRA